MVAARIVYQFIKCLPHLAIHIALCQYHISIELLTTRSMAADATYHLLMYPHHQQCTDGRAPHGVGAQMLIKGPGITGGRFYFLQHTLYGTVFGCGTAPASQAADGLEVQVEIAIAEPAKQKTPFFLALPGYDVEAVRRQGNLHYTACFSRWAPQHHAVPMCYQIGCFQPHQIANPKSGAAAKYKDVLALLQVVG